MEMKKLSLVFTMAAAGFLAQNAVASYNVIDTKTPAITVLQDEFSAIDNSELPAAVTDAFAKDFPDAQITKAYVNQEGQYKLEVTKQDGSTTELYADSEGNWIDM